MEVEIHTRFDEVVIALLQEARLLEYNPSLKKINHPILLPDDEQLFEWRAWISAAISCGLIEGGRVR